MWLPGQRPRAALYLHDGQNVFGPPTPSHPTWRADESAPGLVARGLIAPLAIVTVDHAARHATHDFLLPWTWTNCILDMRPVVT